MSRWKLPRWKRTPTSTPEPAPQFRGTVASEGKLHATLTRSNGSQTLIVLIPDGQVFTFPSEHPNFVTARDLAFSDNAPKDADSYRKLFDVEEAVRDLFGVITDRVRVAEGIVYFDDVRVHNTVTERILDFMEQGRTDLSPLARFMENVNDNPNEKCRETLFEWLEANKLALDDDGHVICFKGVSSNYTPSRRGPGIVDGVDLGDNALIEYKPGSIVSIERSKCNEGAAHCGVGLHVANEKFARNFNGQRVIEVRVNPRDVVSVRLDGRDKIRCCRLRVVGDVPPGTAFANALKVGV